MVIIDRLTVSVNVVLHSQYRLTVHLTHTRTSQQSYHGLTTVSATEASLLLDPEYGMLYRQNSDTTSAFDSLGAN